ncbi:nitroreductase [Burkholderia sp. Bp9142]|uniref:nitroreductase n=1 Tax=Burkholderia sp. Bp9142 TaxID=2184573 RepID=UPI000F59582D|nr:nitroreductase [Burkholderia sp. Bp9142]RQR25744.1 nitroreductase [Burkholderia sp. Bp9142]
MTDTPLFDALRSVLDARFSCRGYLSREVPAETIDAILSIAQRTPSWCNSQPWQIIVTRPAATNRLRSALQAASALPNDQWEIAPPAEYRGIYRDRRRTCGLQLYESVGIAAGDREASARQAEENFRLFGAPHVAVVTTEALLGTYGVLDCGAYVNNFMLAAASLGVSAIAQAALASKAHALREILSIPPERRVVCGISFGYADPSHPANAFRTERAPLDQVATIVTR